MFSVHLGLDDTDSEEGMCTTYLTTIILQKLLKEKIEMLDYPNLIRLNPNIPWKTRGNAALCLRLKTNNPNKIFKIAKNNLIKYSESKKGKANSGLIMLCSEQVPDEIKKFAIKCLYESVKMSELKQIINSHEIEYFGQGTKRGLIGALAAIGNTLLSDHTYELIGYRKNNNGERGVSLTSVIKMDNCTELSTFNNIDYNNYRILITPHGKDPICFAIRGNNSNGLYKAMTMLELYEPIERFAIFRTNQGTNEHLKKELDLNQLKSFQSGYTNGIINKKPVTKRGGHVFLEIKSKNRIINCAIYAPSIALKKAARKLEKGDSVEVGGGIRRKSKKYKRILNAEYIKINNLVQKIIIKNPICKKCQKTMKSIGYEKGFKCKKCSIRTKESKKKTIKREIKLGLYLPIPSSQRHLTKPINRYGKENHKMKNKPKGVWFKVF